MQTIFYGFLFVFLDFNLNLNGVVLGLLPDFVGFLLIARGLREIEALNSRFVRVRPWVIGMVVYTLILYMLDLMAGSVKMDLLSLLLGIAGLVVQLYISFQIVTGITELETERSWHLQGQQLKTVWTYMAVLNGIAYVFCILPLLNVFCVIASCVVGICFLVFFHKTAALYREYQSA